MPTENDGATGTCSLWQPADSKKDNSASKKQYLFVGVQIFQAKALVDKQAK